MFVPIIASSPHTTVINKTIVYSDTVLNLKDKGENLKITTIKGVNKYQLELCLNMILENNSDIIFNTIQYSENEKKVYFYANKIVATDAWAKRNDINYEPLATTNEILKEIRTILASDRSKDEVYISVYDFVSIMRSRFWKYDNLKKNLYYELDYKIGNDLRVFKLPDFDFKNMELLIECRTIFGDGCVSFAKNNDDLYIKKSNLFFDNEIIYECGNALSEFYNEVLKYKDLELFNYTPINSVNSNFAVKMSYNLITIYIKDKRFDFYLDAKLDSDKCDCTCNSNYLLNTVRGSENEILNKIFIKISDCPENIHDVLTDFRLNQLIVERKKEKRLKIRKKIFPFLK